MEKREWKKRGNKLKTGEVEARRKRWRQNATFRETKLPFRRFSETLEFGVAATRRATVCGMGKLATLTHSLTHSLSRPKIISVQPFFLLLLCSSSNSSGESIYALLPLSVQ